VLLCYFFLIHCSLGSPFVLSWPLLWLQASNKMLKGTGCRLPVSGWLEPVPDLLKQKKFWVSSLINL
jgi:hypothetical protein